MARDSLQDVVDKLGAIRAQISDLEKEEQLLRQRLIFSGKSEVDGKAYRATVSRSVRKVLDMAAVRAKLSARFLSAHTFETEQIRVNVVARIH